LARVVKGDFGEARGAETAPLRSSSVACLNLTPEPGNVEGNLLLAEREILRAREADPLVRWVVLPELFTCGYTGLATVGCHAEDAKNGISARFFTKLARDLGLYVAYGFAEGISGREGLFGSANLVGPQGVVLTYRKRNPVRTTPECRVFEAGTRTPVVEAGGVRVALAICWDLGFPEVAREAALLGGADLILAPAAWRAPWGFQYDLSCAARALDSGVYVASANQLGAYPEALFDAPGHLYGPDGGRASRSTGVASIGTLDPLAPGRWRRYYGDTLGEGEVVPLGEEPVEICS
jgi:predicted amidohydrolase